ncbi:MAG: hypothetical protein ABSD75_27375 [Terriglobales bacterium]|jgi:hypothetical protein
MTEARRVHFPRHRSRTLAVFLCPTVLFTAGAGKIDLDAANRIRDTALNHSRVMEMTGYVAGEFQHGNPFVSY